MGHSAVFGLTQEFYVKFASVSIMSSQTDEIPDEELFQRYTNAPLANPPENRFTPINQPAYEPNPSTEDARRNLLRYFPSEREQDREDPFSKPEYSQEEELEAEAEAEREMQGIKEAKKAQPKKTTGAGSEICIVYTGRNSSENHEVGTPNQCSAYPCSATYQQNLSIIVQLSLFHHQRHPYPASLPSSHPLTSSGSACLASPHHPQLPPHLPASSS